MNRSIRTSESLLPSKKGKEQFALFKKSEKRTSKPDMFIAYSCAETIEAQNCDEVDTNLSNILTDYDNRFLTKWTLIIINNLLAVQQYIFKFIKCNFTNYRKNLKPFGDLSFRYFTNVLLFALGLPICILVLSL